VGLGVAITFLGTCTHVILRHVDATLSYRWGGVGWGGVGRGGQERSLALAFT